MLPSPRGCGRRRGYQRCRLIEPESAAIQNDGSFNCGNRAGRAASGPAAEYAAAGSRWRRALAGSEQPELPAGWPPWPGHCRTIEQHGIYRGQEWRRACRRRPAVPGAPGGAGQEKPGSRPGHPDEQQPSLLGQVRGGGRPRAGKPEREQPSLAAGQEDDIELQALGRVQGQQRDCLGPRIQGIRQRANRDLGEEPLQVTAAAAGLVPGRPTGCRRQRRCPD